MKLVQYWIRCELSSFSLFRCFLVDVDEDFGDTTMNIVTMNMVLMMKMARSPQSNNLPGYPGDRDPSGIAFHLPDDQ